MFNDREMRLRGKHRISGRLAKRVGFISGSHFYAHQKGFRMFALNGDNLCLILTSTYNPYKSL